MVRNKDGVAPDRFHEQSRKTPSPRRETTFTRSPSAMLRREAVSGCISTYGSGHWSTRNFIRRVWLPGEILKDDASAGEDQWKLSVRLFLCALVFERMKFCLAVRMIEPVLKEPQRSRMIFRGARPENAVLAPMFPCDAAVIGCAAA